MLVLYIYLDNAIFIYLLQYLLQFETHNINIIIAHNSWFCELI